MTYFAESLKKLRKEAGLSMQKLADHANVCKSMICKIERNEVQPTLDVAGRLAKALGKTLSELLHAPQGSKAIHLTPQEQAVWEDTHNIKRRNISPVLQGLKTEWLQVTMPPGIKFDKTMQIHAIGIEKYILVKQGRLNIQINETEYQLNKDDSFYFEANQPHAFHNPATEPCEFFILIKHG